MDNLPVGRIEQLTYNDKLKADIAKLMAENSSRSELDKLKIELATLRMWGKAMYKLMSIHAVDVQLDTLDNLLKNAPDSVKGSE